MISSLSSIGLPWGALLVVTLCFDTTREAHMLCGRWLLHLDGHTTVQGLPNGYGGPSIPSVQFTPEYKRLLESRATNSLEDFFLASAGDFQFASQAQPPRDEASPLLPAMVFRMVLRSSSTNSNALTPASMDSVRRMIQMARSSNPANGAVSQAEACFDFANNDPDAALRALWISCSNRNWNACAAASFAGFSDLFERAGLSKLDAAVEAMQLEPLEGGYIPSCNWGQFLLEECAKVTGGVAMLMLSMLCFTLMYKVIRWRQVRSLGVWWRKTGFWLLSLVMFLLCLNICSRFVHVIATGWDNELDPIEGLYLFSILFWIIITLLVFELIKWPRPKAQMNSWKVVHGFAVVYLMAIIAMGFFRSEVVAYYVAMYQ